MFYINLSLLPTLSSEIIFSTDTFYFKKNRTIYLANRKLIYRM